MEMKERTLKPTPVSGKEKNPSHGTEYRITEQLHFNRNATALKATFKP